MSRLSDSHLNNLTTKRLLSYYKSERRKMYGIISLLTYRGDILLCDALLYSDDDPDVIRFRDQESFCIKIKSILDNREHV